MSNTVRGRAGDTRGRRPLRVGMEVRRLLGEPLTGVDYATIHLIEAMARAGHELWLYWRRGDGVALPAPIPVSPLLHTRPFELAHGWQTAGVPVRAWLDRVDVLHFPGGLMSYWCPMPSIVTGFDLIWERLEHLFEPYFVHTFRKGVGRSLRRADHVIAISEYTKRDLMELYRLPEERITVVPLAPDPSLKPMPWEAAQPVLHRYGLSRPYLLYVGAVLPHKNVAGLLRAYAAARASNGDFPDLLVAGPPERRVWELAGLARSLGIAACYQHLGYVPRDDLPALYAGAVAFVMPSLYEGFGLPPLDAMSCGVPVACSNATSLPEVVGEAALLFDPSDEEAMADALQRIVADEALRRELRARGLERVKEFSWERTAEATWAVYELVAGR